MVIVVVLSMLVVTIVDVFVHVFDVVVSNIPEVVITVVVSSLVVNKVVVSVAGFVFVAVVLSKPKLRFHDEVLFLLVIELIVSVTRLIRVVFDKFIFISGNQR